MTEDKPAGPRGPARRRLLRGVFGAPAVLTLYSGGALAATSNQLRCIANQNQPGSVLAAPVPDTTNSTFLRVQLYQKGGVGGKYYVMGSLLPPAAVGSGLPASGQWREFDVGANKLTGISDLPNGQYGLVSTYAALRVNSAGLVVDVGNTTTTAGSAIYQSCWTSFVV